MTDKQAIELTKRLQVYAAIIATCILFGSLILHRTSIIWETI